MNITCSIDPELEKNQMSPTNTKEETEEKKMSLMIHTDTSSFHSMPHLTPKMPSFTSQAPPKPPPPKYNMTPHTRPPPHLGPPPSHVSARPPPRLGPPPSHVSARPPPPSGPRPPHVSAIPRPPLETRPPHVSERQIPSSNNVDTRTQKTSFKNKIFETISSMNITSPSPNILPFPPKEWLCSK